MRQAYFLRGKLNVSAALATTVAVAPICVAAFRTEKQFDLYYLSEPVGETNGEGWPNGLRSCMRS